MIQREQGSKPAVELCSGPSRNTSTKSVIQENKDRNIERADQACRSLRGDAKSVIQREGKDRNWVQASTSTTQWHSS